MGIILEDDCLPSVDFFNFCRIMLKTYKNKNINAICGSRFIPEDSKKEIYFLNTIMLGDGQRGENLGKNLILKLNFEIF